LKKTSGFSPEVLIVAKIFECVILLISGSDTLEVKTNLKKPSNFSG